MLLSCDDIEMLPSLANAVFPLTRQRATIVLHCVQAPVYRHAMSQPNDIPSDPAHELSADSAPMSPATPVPEDSGEELASSGFLRLSAMRRRQLGRLLLASLVGVLTAGATTAGIVVFTSMREAPPTFTTPPPSRTYEPKQLEHKVKVQKRQRSSSRPAVVPRIVSTKPSDISLPEVKMDPKLVTTSFQPKFKAVSGKGLGAGLGTGYGTSGFGEGVSSVNFFGIQARGERIGVLVDVSISMVEDERGGVPGFARVKARVGEVVDALREGTLFTVIAFADGCDRMSSELKHANAATRNEAKSFIRPFNIEGSYGLDSGNYSGSPHGKQANGGTTRLDLAIGAAMDLGCDTLLVISDGMPMVEKALDGRELRDYEAKIADWQKRMDSYTPVAGREERVWIPPRPAVPAAKQKLKEGQPPPHDIPAVEGHWETRRVGASHPPKRPEPPKSYWTLADFTEHIDGIYDAVYKPQGRKKPSVHTIGYPIDKEGNAFLQALARQYHGQYRRVQSLKK